MMYNKLNEGFSRNDLLKMYKVSIKIFYLALIYHKTMNKMKHSGFALIKIVCLMVVSD